MGKTSTSTHNMGGHTQITESESDVYKQIRF